MPMTFDEFRATGRDVDDLDKFVPDMDLDGVGGRIYLDDDGPLWIERFGGGWLLTVERSQYQGEDLEPLEKTLYNFALGEGIV